MNKENSEDKTMEREREIGRERGKGLVENDRGKDRERE